MYLKENPKECPQSFDHFGASKRRSSTDLIWQKGANFTTFFLKFLTETSKSGEKKKTKS